MKGIIGAFLGGMVICVAARAEEGCSKDVDCKGDRICVQRQCVEAPEKTSDASGQATIPTSYRTDPPPPPEPRQSDPIVRAPQPRDPTYHRHLGAFIRPDLGLGYVAMSASNGGTDVTIKGAAGTFGFAAGGALSENSILAFHLWDTVMSNPTVSSGGLSSDLNGDVTLLALGLQYTAYSQQNFYFSFSPSLTRAHFSGNGSSGDTDWGFGMRAAVGKEWWVGDHWGLGLVGHLSASWNKDSGSNSPTWNTWGATIAFSATYN
jgi:hypothetical protein